VIGVDGRRLPGLSKMNTVKNLCVTMFVLALLLVALLDALGNASAAGSSVPSAHNAPVLGWIGFSVLVLVGYVAWGRRGAPQAEDRTRFSVRRRALPPAPVARGEPYERRHNANEVGDQT
jgi:hypothetical protein